MRLYTNKHQWTKLYVYVSVFGPVTHHIIIKYRSCHTTQYENSVIKLVMVYYLIKPRFFYIIILLCILGSILYHIYIQTLVIFIVLQSSMVPIASKNILQQLPEIYYEGQVWLPMIRRTWVMNIFGIYTLRGTNVPNCMFMHPYLVK